MTGKIVRSLFFLAMLVLAAGACLFSGILYGYYEKQSFASLSQEAEQLSQSMAYIAPEKLLENNAENNSIRHAGV